MKALTLGSEGLEETFTVNRLGLTATLMKCLTTTNIIENSNGTVRRQTRRVSRWQNGAMGVALGCECALKCRKEVSSRQWTSRVVDVGKRAQDFAD